MTTDLMPRRLNSFMASATSRSFERRLDLAVGRHDAFGHRDAVAPLDQRPLLPGDLEMQREIIRPLVPADVQDVAEVSRRQHPDFGAVVLDRDVGGDRRPVHDQRHVIGTNAGNLAQLAQPLEHALGLVMRGAGDLVDEDAVVRLENEVGVGPADIDAYARHGSPESSPRRRARPGCTTPLLSTDRRGNIVSIGTPVQPPHMRPGRHRQAPRRGNGPPVRGGARARRSARLSAATK